jgi:hypothetical protein
VQFTRRDWRNRNAIKSPDGLHWLTIPVAVKGRYLQKINETMISDRDWRERHLSVLRHTYAKAAHFAEGFSWIEEVYGRLASSQLSQVNRLLIEAVCARLGILTPLRASSDYPVVDGKNERLIEICVQAGATHYLSGPAARAYLDEHAFNERGIRVEWMDYEGYPEYPQLYPPFEHKVSILDLILHTGSQALQYVRRT